MSPHSGVPHKRFNRHSNGLYVKRHTFSLTSSQEELRAAAYFALTELYGESVPKPKYAPERASDGETAHENEETQRIKAWMQGVSQFTSPQEFQTAPRSPTSEMMVNHAIRQERDDRKAKDKVNPTTHRKNPRRSHSYPHPNVQVRPRRESVSSVSSGTTFVNTSDLQREFSSMIRSLSKQKASSEKKNTVRRAQTEPTTAGNQDRPRKLKPLGEYTMTSQGLGSTGCKPPPITLQGDLQHEHHHHYYHRIAPETSAGGSVHYSRDVEHSPVWVSRDRGGELQYERISAPRRSRSAKYPTSRSDTTRGVKAVSKCQVM